MVLWIRNRGKRLDARPGQPVLASGTLTWSGDRNGTACLDRGGSVDVVLPNALTGLPTGTRIALTRYPDGWVVVGWWASGPDLRLRPQPGDGRRR